MYVILNILYLQIEKYHFSIFSNQNEKLQFLEG